MKTTMPSRTRSFARQRPCSSEKKTHRPVRRSHMTDGTTNKRNQMLNKVPEITVFFWIIKVLCTTVGETASDFLNVNLNFGLTGTSIAMGLLLAAALVVQFRARGYIPIVYWLNVVLISIFGTLVTDNLT